MGIGPARQGKLARHGIHPTPGQAQVGRVAIRAARGLLIPTQGRIQLEAALLTHHTLQLMMGRGGAGHNSERDGNLAHLP